MGIAIHERGERVVIDVETGHWEGSAADTERLLTRLHYVLARARPGTNIASMFLNDELWGGKFIETDRRAALREMRHLVDQLSSRLALLEQEAEELQT